MNNTLAHKFLASPLDGLVVNFAWSTGRRWACQNGTQLVWDAAKPCLATKMSRLISLQLAVVFRYDNGYVVE